MVAVIDREVRWVPVSGLPHPRRRIPEQVHDRVDRPHIGSEPVRPVECEPAHYLGQLVLDVADHVELVVVRRRGFGPVRRATPWRQLLLADGTDDAVIDADVTWNGWSDPQNPLLGERSD